MIDSTTAKPGHDDSWCEYDKVSDAPEPKYAHPSPSPSLSMLADDDPLIPDGEYTFLCLGHAKRQGMRGAIKFRLKMQVQGGAYDGTILYKHFNIRGVTKEGRIMVGAKSDLLRRFYAVTGSPKITRLDRFSMSAFDGLLIRATVVTVKKDWEGDELPHQSHYSRVGKLLGKVT